MPETEKNMTETEEVSNVETAVTEVEKKEEVSVIDEPVTTPNTELSVDDLEAEVARWKASSRRHESRMKQLAAEKDSFEKVKLTLEGDLHKHKTELEEIKKEAKEATLNSFKTSAASEFAIPNEALKYLKGGTAEEIRESAAEIATIFGTSQKKTESKGISIQGIGKSDAVSDKPSHLVALEQWAANRKK